LVAERAELHHVADDTDAGPVVKNIIPLLQETNNLQNMETEFRASCKKKRAGLVACIKQRQDPAPNLAEQAERQADVETMYEADLLKLGSV